jgi:CubicO group peptidase (beta-lactamase class C family)
MKRSRIQTLCFSAVLLLTSCASWAQELHTKVEQYMQASMKVDHFMGSVLIAQHGKLLFAQGYGMANVKLGIPNTPETEFWIGSITKQFTAMAILELQERGKLSVQDSVCKYVPDCPKDWGAITIYNLLTHTSGIPDFTSFPNYLKISAQPTTPAQLLALFENKPLEFKPGAKFRYSNSGYEVLGYLIQRISGETYQEFLQKNIFAPLGLKNTGYASSHPAGRNQAQGYIYSGTGYVPAPYVNMTVPFSAGALYSTVLDLYKWDRALEANALIPRKAMEEMLAPHVAMGGPGNAHYGFGWVISTEFGRKVISHEGGINGFTSFNSWFPDDHAYVIALDNVSSPEISAVSHALTAILFGQHYETPREYKAITVRPDELEKFVGQYQLAPSFIITVRRKGDQLTAQATGQPAAPIYPESKTEFFYKVVEAQISFVRSANGQVTGLVLHQNGHDMPAKKINSAVPVVPPGPKAISVPASTLQKYVGEYQLEPGFVITITREGDQLSAQATGQPGAPIYPESKTKFFYKVVEAQISFVQSANGPVTGLVLHQNGRDLPAKKIR